MLPSVDESPEEIARRAYLHGMMLQGRLPAELAFEHAAQMGSRARPATRATGAPAHVVDPFRNFQAEAAAWTPAAAAPSAAGAGARQGGAPAARGPSANLSKLFAPPEGLLVRGPHGEALSFNDAAAEALRRRKWLLVNVQQGAEFASHQLNRDCWSNAAVRALVQSAFVFHQINHSTVDGMRYRNTYHPPSVPSIAIIDPLTKQKMWDCHADVAEDYGNAALISPAALAKGEIIVAKRFIQRLQRVLKEWAARTDMLPEASPAAGAPQQAGAAASEEERMLQAAIQASMQTAATGAAKPALAATAANSSAAAAAAASAVSSSSSHSDRPTGLERRGNGSRNPPAPVRGGSAKSVPIVLDDSSDDDDDAVAGSRGDGDESDEEYVQISDSDGELDARVAARPGTRDEAEDDDASHSSASSSAAAAATASAALAAHRQSSAVSADADPAAGQKRKRQEQQPGDGGGEEDEEHKVRNDWTGVVGGRADSLSGCSIALALVRSRFVLLMLLLVFALLFNSPPPSSAARPPQLSTAQWAQAQRARQSLRPSSCPRSPLPAAPTCAACRCACPRAGRSSVASSRPTRSNSSSPLRGRSCSRNNRTAVSDMIFLFLFLFLLFARAQPLRAACWRHGPVRIRSHAHMLLCDLCDLCVRARFSLYRAAARQRVSATRIGG